MLSPPWTLNDMGGTGKGFTRRHLAGRSRGIRATTVASGSASAATAPEHGYVVAREPIIDGSARSWASDHRNDVPDVR